jgi:hypothetical protein
MPKVVMAAVNDRSGLPLLAIWAVLVLAGGMGAVMLSAMNIPSPYGDILFIAAAFVALILTFPIAVWIEDKIATRRSGVA